MRGPRASARGGEGERAEAVTALTKNRPHRKGGDDVAAWRPNRSVIEGELDNTTPGRVTGRMSFVGLPGPVTVDLRGDFHRDIRGAKIRFENRDRPEPTEEVRQYMEGFATHQTGVAGDMTAGLPPQDYVDYPYLEWYSDQNGRVVLEFEPEQVQVIGTPLDWRKEQPVSREAQGRNMGKFLSEVAASFSPRPEAGHPEGPPAAEKEGP